MSSVGNGSPGFNSFGSRITLDTFNNRVFNHEVFTISKRFTLGPLAVHNIVIKPTENGAFPKNTFVVLPLNFKGFGAGPLNIDLYTDTESNNDGTLWGSVDRNFKNSITPHLIVRLNPTITNIGNLNPLEFAVFSDGFSAFSTIGGESKDDLLFVGDQDKDYTLQITNTDITETAEGVFTFNWFEV